ncbi:MAG TPA: peptide ABC transporter substrate-binding protein [Myxococcota bacterium]|nr:peptide ABC transporter substrate-binding protein [Myxococcota bacterium]
MLVFLLHLLLVFVTSCGGCQQKAKNDAKKMAVAKKSITIGIAQEPDSLFMPFKEMMASEEVVRAGTYTLTIFDQNWRIVPWAATEIPTRENGQLELFAENGIKKMRTTWKIREDFNWPDGTPLTADDFVFAHKIMMDPSQEIIDRTTDEKIEKMESRGQDSRTLVVTWKEPYAYYHNYRQHEALPKHLLEPVYNQAPDQLKKSRFGQAPALAGAYTIKEWVPGSHIIAERNAKAKGALVPFFDEIIWRIIPETNTLESNLVSGTVDAISPIGLSLEQALQFEKRHKDDFDFHYTEGLMWEHIDFNLDNEILKDKRVRQALAYGSDREAIAKNLFFGRQPVAFGTEPPRSPFFNPNISKYAFDPERAKQLLDEAGWLKPSGKDIREKNGKPLALTIMTTSGSKTRERVEQLLQSQWADIGVDVRIKNEPAKIFFGETTRKRKFDGMAMYAWIKDPLRVSDTLWRCDYIPSAKNHYLGQNLPGFCHKRADELLQKAARELDPQKRAKIGQDFEEIFAEELPSLPLYFQVEVSVTKKGLKNWQPTGMLQPISWNAHLWSWN